MASIALVAPACASSSNSAEIRPSSYRRNVALPTTTIVRSTLPRSSTTTTQATATERAASPGSTDAALMSVVGSLAADPDLVTVVGRLRRADAATLAGVFGLDPGVTEQLGLSLEQVQGLAAILAALDPTGFVDRLGARLGAPADRGALDELMVLAERFDGAAIAAIDGLTRDVVTGIVDAVRTAMGRVDPATLAVLSALLDQLDPTGLGALATGDDTSALLAVLASAVMRANPPVAPQLRARASTQPRVVSLVDHLSAVGATMGRREALLLTAVAARMDGEALDAMAALVEIALDPDTSRILDRLRTA